MDSSATIVIHEKGYYINYNNVVGNFLISDEILKKLEELRIVFNKYGYLCHEYKGTDAYMMLLYGDKMKCKDGLVEMKDGILYLNDVIWNIPLNNFNKLVFREA